MLIGGRVAVKASNGKFVHVHNDITLKLTNNSDGYDIAFYVPVTPLNMVIQTYNRKCLSNSQGNGQIDLVSDFTDIGLDELFDIISLGLNKIALRANNGMLLSVDANGQDLSFKTITGSIGPDETFEVIPIFS